MKNGPTARGLVSYRCRLFKTSRCILACAAIALRCGIAVLPAHQAHAGDGACLQRGVGRARVMLTVLDWAAACQLSGNAVPTPHTSPPPPSNLSYLRRDSWSAGRDQSGARASATRRRCRPETMCLLILRPKGLPAVRGALACTPSQPRYKPKCWVGPLALCLSSCAPPTLPGESCRKLVRQASGDSRKSNVTDGHASHVPPRWLI